jgi:hypothetical protein
MLQTIREFAGERLQASGEADELRCKHVLWFLRLLEPEPGASWLKYTIPDGGVWSRRVEDERDNLDAALSWCLEHGEIELGAQITWSVSYAWRHALRLSERRRWIIAFMKPDRLESRLLRSHAYLLLADIEKEPDTRKRLGDLALALCRESGDDAELLLVLNMLAGDTLYGDAYGRRDDAPVEPLLEEALELARRLGARSVEAALLRMYAEVAQRGGENSRADGLLEQSLAIEQAVGHRTGIAYTLHALAWRARATGDLAKARALGFEALSVYAEVGERRTRQEMLLSLAMIALERRDGDEARSLTREALHEHLNLLGMDEEADLYTAVWLLISARTMILLDRPEEAVRLWGAIEDVLVEEHEELGEPARLRAELDRVELDLGSAAYLTALETGKAMSVPDAARYALTELSATAGASV